MGRRRGPFATRNPWRTIGIQVCFWLTLVTAAVGFVVLPITGRGAAERPWAAICSAVGIGAARPQPVADASPAFASSVRWTPESILAARAGDAARGRFVALNCAACHGDEGISREDWIPNLAGLRSETIVKQLVDYKTGHRLWPVMNGIGAALTTDDIRNVASYFSALPRSAPVSRADGEPPSAGIMRLVYDGAPARGIAPCASCHGLGGLKRAAPVLGGLQAAYIERQLFSFKIRERANDEGEQMRVVAASLTLDEIHGLAKYVSKTEAETASLATVDTK